MKEFFVGIFIIAILGAGSYLFVGRGKKAEKTEKAEVAQEPAEQKQQAAPTQAQNVSSKTSLAAPKTTPAPPASTSLPAASSVAPSTLQIETVQAGGGTGAKSGDTLEVHYTGNLWSGAVFDSSSARGVPFEFTLGRGEVILGWDEGMIGMKKGEVRKLVIPPDYGYGQYGTPNGSIPPNATLVFTVELLSLNGQ